MQEQLNLTTIPEIDTAILSNVGEFKERILTFNNKWKINLEFNENARWRPGSYERLKEQVINAVFPHWNEPKGANTIKKLMRFDSYRVRDLKQQMVDIDNILRNYRADKVCLKGDEAAKEGKELLDYILDAYLNHKTDDVIVRLDSLPYWNRNPRNVYDYNYELGWDKPLYPLITKDMGWNGVGYYGTQQAIDKRLELNAKDNTDPKRWFINIMIPLKDINIKCYQGNWEPNKSNKILAELPYGDIMIGFSIPVFDLVMNYRKLRKNTSRYSMRGISSQHLTNHTYKFPYIEGIKHPYVYRGNNDNWYPYSWGNTCFGDFNDDILKSIYTANIPLLKHVIDIWASSFYLGHTSPLNSIYTCHIGQPKEWDTITKAAIATEPNVCRIVLDKGMLKKDMLSKFCSNCGITKTCDVHKMLTFIPRVLPDKFIIAICKNWKTLTGNDPENELVFSDSIIVQILKVIAEKYLNHPEHQFPDYRNLFHCPDGDTFISHENAISWEDSCKAFKFKDGIIRKDFTDVYDEDWDSFAQGIIFFYKMCERKYYTSAMSEINSDVTLQWIKLMQNEKKNWQCRSFIDVEEALPIKDMTSTIVHNRLTLGMNESFTTYQQWLSACIPIK